MAFYGRQWLSLLVVLSMVALSYQLTCYECITPEGGHCTDQQTKVCGDRLACGSARLTQKGVTTVARGCTCGGACKRLDDRILKDLFHVESRDTDSTISCNPCKTADLCNKD